VVIRGIVAGVRLSERPSERFPGLIEFGVSGLLVESGRADVWIEAVGTLTDIGTAERLGNGPYRSMSRVHSPETGLDGLEHAYLAAFARCVRRLRGVRSRSCSNACGRF
jgi:hypothetical protein